MSSGILMILAGFLVRADGWHNDKYKRLSAFFSGNTCAVIFAAFIWVLMSDWPIALASGVAFLVWRLPGFRNGGLNFLPSIPAWMQKWVVTDNGWQSWRNMFVRGFWTSLIGFALVSVVLWGHPAGALLAVPFSIIYMTIYSGGYSYLPQTILGYDRHVWIEHASGWAFAAFLLGVI